MLALDPFGQARYGDLMIISAAWVSQVEGYRCVDVNSGNGIVGIVLSVKRSAAVKKQILATLMQHSLYRSRPITQ